MARRTLALRDWAREQQSAAVETVAPEVRALPRWPGPRVSSPRIIFLPKPSEKSTHTRGIVLGELPPKEPPRRRGWCHLGGMCPININHPVESE